MSEVLRRPKWWPNADEYRELTELLHKRAILDEAVELAQELASQDLDERLSAAGYATRPRRNRWPCGTTRAERSQGPLRRGPWCWGDKVKAYVR